MSSADHQTARVSFEDSPQSSKRRYRGIAAAGASALFGKGASLLVNAATVPITVRYLGPESYGLWITISSTITMFFVLDIGISSTLTNLISDAFARHDRRRAAACFATAFWILAGIAAILAIAAWIAWPRLNWPELFHVQSASLAHETSRAMAAAFLIFLLALPFGLVTKIMAGYQELHVANLFTAGGSLLSLLLVLVVVYFRGTLSMLVFCYAGSSVAANIACLLWLCIYNKPWLKPWPTRFESQLIAPIFHSGIQFFAIQLAGLIVFSSDNLIISHYLSPAQVTPYSVTWRLVNYLAVLQTLIFPALWPAYSEAWARGDLNWIRATYKHVRQVTIVILAIGCILTISFGQPLIRIWAGPSAVPSALLIRLMCVWIAIYAFTMNQSCLMAATNRVGKQSIYGILAAIANLILSIVWVKTMGPVGVLLATIVSYLIFILGMQVWEVHRIQRGDFMVQRL